LKGRILGLRVSSGPVPARVTVTEIGNVSFALVPAPPNIKLYIPAATDELAVRMRVDWLPEVIVAGLKDAVIPEGRLAMPRLTLWLDPLVVAVTTLYATDPPCITVCAAGDA
jgi:hypothetical protein